MSSRHYRWPENLYRRLLFCPPTTMPTGCIEFTGARERGYGRIRKDGRSEWAHRAVWELMIGPIPDDLEPDHLCRNRACVNVGHLELVTHAENVLRGESVSAVHARKTHCVHGHEFSPENTAVYRGPTGRPFRQCLTCRKDRYERG